jgi:hypothetical protein
VGPRAFLDAVVKRKTQRHSGGEFNEDKRKVRCLKVGSTLCVALKGFLCIVRIIQENIT